MPHGFVASPTLRFAPVGLGHQPMNEDAAAALARASVTLGAAVVLVRTALMGTARRERSRSRLQFASLAMVAAVWIVFAHPVVVTTPAWYDASLRPLGFLAMLAAGALVSWAYVRMGRYWDGLISVLPDHRVVDDGPFALVRHPVYLGLILFNGGAALLLADPVVGAVAAATAVVLVFRARAEERFLEERLGEAYRDYRRRVPMFVPRLGR